MGTGSYASVDQRGQQLDEVENLLLEICAGPVVKLPFCRIRRKSLRTGWAGQPAVQALARGPCRSWGLWSIANCCTMRICRSGTSLWSRLGKRLGWPGAHSSS